MWSRYYRFGDVVLQIESQIEINESERFAIFRVEEQKADFIIQIHTGEMPGLPAIYDGINGEKYQWKEDGEQHILRFMQTKEGNVPYSYTRINEDKAIQIYTQESQKYLGVRLVLEGFDFFELLNRKRAITLHSSYVKCGENAILFSGSSGVGKSTQARLWEEYRNAKTVNGDRTLIQKRNHSFYAHGICYAGTSKICHNISVPIKAIVVLKQASVNQIHRMSGKESLKALLSQCAFHKTNKNELLILTSVLAELLTEVPVYLLKCTPDVRAIEVLEEVL